MTELAQDRDALAAALGAQTTEEDERLAAEAVQRRELERRRQACSVEALAGDKTALAEIEEVETRLNELERRDELHVLAVTEQSQRDRRKATAEDEANREQWGRQKADVEARRDAELLKIEKALGTLVAAIPCAIELDIAADVLGKRIAPGYRQGPAKRAIEYRLSRRLGEVGMHDLGFVLSPNAGSEPLATPKPRQRRADCSVCAHDQRAAIDEQHENGASLRALQDAFGVSRSALSRHFAGHSSC